ncbi:CgeB family protein [Paenibacillus guangzhouensis]|uniref:CgeB family protein n=1 Tax=Paenibacillus guangzhouensis TaxID=1473112 RepID=UPI0012673C5D|nr:glycosyltransferase [Paenibacillus guangzhouensis]
MKIYYIASGYRRPIDMLDNALMKALVGRYPETRFFLLNRSPIQHLLPEIEQYAPDLVLTLCGPKSHLPVDLVHRIRNMGIETAVWFTDDPYAIDNAFAVAAAYDVVFTIDSGCIPFYERIGCKRVFHLPLGTDPDVFRPFTTHPTYHSDVCFVGTGYQNRITFMEELLRHLDREVKVQIVGHFWDTLKLSDGCIPNIRKKWVNTPETVRYYNGAKVVLNIHRSHDDAFLDKNKTGVPGYSINNRTFDIAACNAYQLTDFRPDLEQCYTLGEEITSFSSPKECAEQIHAFVHDDSARTSMAKKAYDRTLQRHTFANRLETMLGILHLTPNKRF